MNICKYFNQTKLKDRKQFIIICKFQKKTHKRCSKYLVLMIIKVIPFNNAEIGMLLIALAALFQTLGVLLFFKRSLILISNVKFSLMILDSILRRIVFLCWNFWDNQFFYKERYLFWYEGKIKGSIIYFCGFILIVIGMALVGTLV